MDTTQDIFDAQRDAIVQYATDNTLAASQIFNATRQRIESIVGGSLPDGRFLNVRRHAAIKLRDQEDETDMQGVIAKLSGWVEARFPNAEFDRGRQGNGREMTIFFDGKPK